MNPTGNGLGLYISRKICRALGGDLLVTSKVGKGTTFSMTINMYLVNLIPKNDKKIQLQTIFTEDFLKELNEDEDKSDKQEIEMN